MKILVTGGFGFVGRNLTERLVKEGHEVTVVASGSEPKVPGVKKILYMTMEGIHWPEVYGKDVVFHQMANNDTLCNDEHEMLRANLYGPIKLFCCAADGGCKKFVYASSTAVYGNAPVPFTEETPIDPLNAYAKSKVHFDQFAERFAKEKGVSITALRYCNVYGPGEDRKGKRMSMIGQLIRQMMAKKQPVLFRDGKQKRDWVHVKDVVEANILASQISQREHPWSVYNIGSGASISFNEIVSHIGAYTLVGIKDYSEDKGIKYIDCPFPVKYQQETLCDIEKARRELGFSPSFDIRSGIEDYITYLKQIPS